MYKNDDPPKNGVITGFCRNKDLKQELTPGAGQYNTENVWPQGERRRPAYSISARNKYTGKDVVPAPNRYSLPKLIGPSIAVSTKKYEYYTDIKHFFIQFFSYNLEVVHRTQCQSDRISVVTRRTWQRLRDQRAIQRHIMRPT